MTLVIDTSSLNISLGLMNDQAEFVAVWNFFQERHQQSKLLFEGLQQLFAEAEVTPQEITAVALGVGPGSFTGLRVGISLAKTFSFSLNVPLKKFSSQILRDRDNGDQKLPRVENLKMKDFEPVLDLDSLEPIYENDHFA